MLEYTKATAVQAEELSHFVNSAYRGEESKNGWTTEADILGGQRVDAEMLINIINTAQEEMELIWEDKKLVACMHLKWEPEFKSLYVGMLTVSPTLQNKGYGRLLLARAEELAKKAGYVLLRMSVIHLRAELIEYYKRRGFLPTGKILPFPNQDPRYGLSKVGTLHLIEMSKEI